MKYTIAGILAIAAILLIWIARTGNSQDAAIMVVAIVSVVFFATVPNIWNALYRPEDEAQARSAALNNPNAIKVSLPKPSNAAPAAHESAESSASS